jgi:polyisoprenoid-binding protein YceI
LPATGVALEAAKVEARTSPGPEEQSTVPPEPGSVGLPNDLAPRAEKVGAEPPVEANAGVAKAKAAARETLEPRTRVAQPAAVSALRVEPTGRATFLIDAPLEKIRGRWTRFGGTLRLDPNDLRQSSGEVTMALGDLKTTTFEDASKNATQTGHALNWMEIGDDVPAAMRAKFGSAKFVFQSLEQVEPRSLVSASDIRSLRATARGVLTLHGIVSEQVVDVQVELEGEPSNPSSVRITTKAPMRVSLRHHDIKPRDLAGRFLSGALEQVGKKIDDLVQVSIELSAHR